MTYQPQQQKEPFPNKPKSPIPPLDYSNIQDKFCTFCNRHIRIQRERISDSDTGRRRYRRVPRNADDEEIHECRRLANSTFNQEGAS